MEAKLAVLRSVIASAKQHPEAQNHVLEIQRLFHSELHESKLARDVDLEFMARMEWPRFC